MHPNLFSYRGAAFSIPMTRCCSSSKTCMLCFGSGVSTNLNRWKTLKKTRAWLPSTIPFCFIGALLNLRDRYEEKNITIFKGDAFSVSKPSYFRIHWWNCWFIALFHPWTFNFSEENRKVNMGWWHSSEKNIQLMGYKVGPYHRYRWSHSPCKYGLIHGIGTIKEKERAITLVCRSMWGGNKRWRLTAAWVEHANCQDGLRGNPSGKTVQVHLANTIPICRSAGTSRSEKKPWSAGTDVLRAQKITSFRLTS